MFLDLAVVESDAFATYLFDDLFQVFDFGYKIIDIILNHNKLIIIAGIYISPA